MSESFADLFEESLKRSEMRTGEVITAEVVRVEHNHVVVNAGLKSEAYVPIEEFKNDKGELEVQAGDFVSVAIGSVENGYGDTILSRDTAKRLVYSMLGAEVPYKAGEIFDYESAKPSPRDAPGYRAHEWWSGAPRRRPPDNPHHIHRSSGTQECQRGSSDIRSSISRTGTAAQPTARDARSFCEFGPTPACLQVSVFERGKHAGKARSGSEIPV